MEYIEGTMDAADRARIGQHVSACVECSSTLANLSAWHEAIASEGDRLRAAMDAQPLDTERMLRECLQRITAELPAPGRSVSEALAALRALLAPIFGQGTVTAAVNQALRRTGLAVSALSASNWLVFIKAFSAVISEICGIAAGRLADLAGISLGSSLLAGGQA